MANYLKNNPVSIDKAIQDAQIKIFDRLNYSNVDGYGRVYIIEKKGVKVPAYYLKGTDYKELLIDDKITGKFFFIPSSNTKKTQRSVTTELNLYFFLDINKIKPGIEHRPDEEVKSEVIAVLDRIANFNWDELETDLDTIKEFTNKIKKKHRILFLKFTGTIKYQFNC